MESAVDLLVSGQIPPLIENNEEDSAVAPMDEGEEEEADEEPEPPQETPEQKAAREKAEHERLVKAEAERDLIDTLAENNDPEAMYDLDLREEQELLATYRSLLVGRGKW